MLHSEIYIERYTDAPTCPEEAALDGALPPVSRLLDDVMHGVEHEGEEDDEEAGHRHEDRPGAVPQGDGAVGAAADRYRAAPSPLEDLVLEARDLGEAGGGRREQEPKQVAQRGRLEIKKLVIKLTFVFIVHAPFLPSMSVHSSASSEWFSGKFHHLQIERGFLLKHSSSWKTLTFHLWPFP